MGPKFSERKELARYIPELHRLSNRRPAAAAFLPDPPDSKPEKQYLSVNALELEPLKEIAEYHRQRAQLNQGKVALSTHKVSFYNDAARKCGIDIGYDRETTSWVFKKETKQEVAYKPHPVTGSDRLNSISHCGVEFVRALRNENEAAKFARRMAGARFHLK